MCVCTMCRDAPLPPPRPLGGFAERLSCACTQVVLEPNADKAERTAVHKCIRTHFAPLESDSVKCEVGGGGAGAGADAQATAVRVFHPRGDAGAWREGALRGRDVQKQGDKRPAKRQRVDDGARVDPKYKFVRFTLFKENRDTMGAISELCRYAPHRLATRLPCACGDARAPGGATDTGRKTGVERAQAALGMTGADVTAVTGRQCSSLGSSRTQVQKTGVHVRCST